MLYEVCVDGLFDMERRLKVATGGFYGRHGRLPVEVAVAPVEVKAVRLGMAEIGLGKVAVVGNGGCLVGEVWLGVGSDKGSTRKE